MTTDLDSVRALVAAINQKAAAAKSGNEGFGQPGAHQAFTLALLNAWPTIAAAVDDLAAQVEQQAMRGDAWRDRAQQPSNEAVLLKVERDALAARLDAARPVLEYVSRGRGFVGVERYPDATARRVLGMEAP